MQDDELIALYFPVLKQQLQKPNSSTAPIAIRLRIISCLIRKMLRNVRMIPTGKRGMPFRRLVPGI